MFMSLSDVFFQFKSHRRGPYQVQEQGSLDLPVRSQTEIPVRSDGCFVNCRSHRPVSLLWFRHSVISGRWQHPRDTTLLSLDILCVVVTRLTVFTTPFWLLPPRFPDFFRRVTPSVDSTQNFLFDLQLSVFICLCLHSPSPLWGGG